VIADIIAPAMREVAVAAKAWDNTAVRQRALDLGWCYRCLCYVRAEKMEYVSIWRPGWSGN